MKLKVYSSDLTSICSKKIGLLTAVIEELCDLITENQGDFSTSSVSVTDLEIELHRAQESLDRMAKVKNIIHLDAFITLKFSYICIWNINFYVIYHSPYNIY